MTLHRRILAALLTALLSLGAVACAAGDDDGGEETNVDEETEDD